MLVQHNTQTKYISVIHANIAWLEPTPQSDSHGKKILKSFSSECPSPPRPCTILIDGCFELYLNVLWISHFSHCFDIIHLCCSVFETWLQLLTSVSLTQLSVLHWMMSDLSNCVVCHWKIEILDKLGPMIDRCRLALAVILFLNMNIPPKTFKMITPD